FFSIMDTVTGTLMRVFLDESDRHGNQPLYMAVVDELQRLGCSGATIFKGIEGYGSHHQVHSARVFDVSTNLPVLIEVVGDEQQIADVIPSLRDFIPEGLITLDKIQMITLRETR
ncbi:MAG: DUF190 domain-containing protein, partial [Vulcanimicrobiaceae bacterium]